MDGWMDGRTDETTDAAIDGCLLSHHTPRHRTALHCRIIAQGDRGAWLRGLILGLFGTQCQYTTEFVKVRH